MAAPAVASKFGEYKQNYVRIGDVAPDFTADTTQGTLSLHEFLGDSWGVFFSHPADFTPVCTTELGRVAQLHPEWTKRNTKVIAVSVDTVAHHHEWITDVNDIGHTQVNFPIIADSDRSVSVLYGMLDQTHVNNSSGQPFTVRSVFIIDPKKIVRLIITYPAATGRSFSEILRVLDSLQLATSHKVATPADWTSGSNCMVLPFVSNEEATTLFPKGFTAVRPWLRTTPDPSVA